MRKPAAILLVALVTCATAFAQPDTAPRDIAFHGISPTDPAGRDGLRNPERGLRTETRFAEPAGAKVWGKAAHLKDKVSEGYSDEWWLLDAKRYEPHGLTIAQTYCYLHEYTDKPIGQEKLDRLVQNLQLAREAGLKCLLRFAYEEDTDRKAGPTLDTILGHMDRLAPVVRDNVDVIYVLQAGFIGAWGEWHSSKHALETDHQNMSRIVAKLLEILPKDRMTEVRVPKYKRWALTEPPLNAFVGVDASNAFSGIPAARIGFHNDGFLAGPTCGGTWTEPPHFSNPGNPEFDYMTNESPFLPVDGELFWSDQAGKVDGLSAAVRMRLHHYSTFSIAHSFSEREGMPFSIDDWMKTPLNAEQVREAKLPLSDGYFQDNDGNPAPRTQFEYIRDHLGYRLELQSARIAPTAATGTDLPVEVTLINRGFSTLHNPRPVYLVLLNAKDEVVLTHRTDADPRQWQPYRPGDETYAPLTHTIRAAVPLPAGLPAGEYRVALAMPDASARLQDSPQYAIRCANRDVPWHSATGTNILVPLAVK